MTRLDDLRGLRDGLLTRLGDCGSDQNYAVLSRTLMDVLNQINEIDPEVVVRKETALDEFTKRLLERRRAGSPDTGSSAADRNLG